jgi:diguanylate cyclase (GGDEF)-like protein/PAS domain S-box-containing protein
MPLVSPLAAVPLTVLTLALASPAAAPRPKPLVYGGSVAFPPYEYLDARGRPRGFNIELIKLLADEAGYEVTFSLGRLKDVLARVDDGSVDLVSLAHSPEREARFDFVAQTWTINQSLLFRPGRSAYPRGLNDLAHEVVAVGDQGASHEALKIHASPQPVIRPLPTTAAAVRALVQGEVTAAAGNSLTLRHFAQQMGQTDLVEVGFLSSGYFLATRQGRAAEFAPLRDALDRLRNTDRFNQLVEQSMVLPRAEPGVPRWALFTAGVAGLLTLVAGGAIAWNRTLRHKVRARTRALEEAASEKLALVEAIRQSEVRFRGMVQSLPLGITLHGARGEVLFANEVARTCLELEPGQQWEDAGWTFLREDGAVLPPAELPVPRVLSSGRELRGQVVGLERPGRPAQRRWLLTETLPSLDASGAVGQVLCTFNDVTAERTLRHERERFFEISPTLHCVIDMTGKFQQVNPASERILGFAPQELLGRSVMDFIHPDDQVPVRETGPRLREGVSGVEVRCRHKDGRYRWLLWNGVSARDQDLIYAVALDVSDRREAEAQIAHLAYHDPLTGLPNRQLFLDRLSVAIARAQRRHEALAVLFIDLDRFKVINDSLGHPIGDLLLKEVGKRLRRSLREEDTVARLGGDEFTAILLGGAAPAQVSRVAQKIREAVKAPLLLGGHELAVSTSIGIGLFPTDGTDPQTLLRSADTAMYRAKELGRDGHQFYTAALGERVREQLNLETRLRRALAREELTLHYQPILNLRRGEIVGLEALLRWQDPDRGLILPDDFIPLGEVTGFIVTIGSWVLRKAAREVQALAGAEGKLRLAVNLSARQFHHADVVDEVAQVLKDTGLPPHRLELEITETVAMQDQEGTIDVLRGLKDLGVRLSIDDFGTGYSSLSYLRRFPIDTVKIDRSFVRDLATDQSAAGIAAAVIAMARQLKLQVVAEGVETPEQLRFLRSQDCDEAQGYLLAYPTPPQDLPKVLVQARQVFDQLTLVPKA